MQVVNPNGDQAIQPYRYLVERAVEPDATIGLGGPRVLAPGDTGIYSVSVKNLANVDAPYIALQFGIPVLGKNEEVFNFDYVTFASNLRGAPPDGGLTDVPWASLDSAINTTGYELAPGYVFDLATGTFTGLSFTAQTYPGLKELIDREFDALREKIYARYPEYRGLLDNGPEGLDQISPGLYEIYQQVGSPLDPDMADQIAFQFSIAAAATALTREEFIAQQTTEALKLRTAILADPTATQALVVLAADATQWTSLYLAALEEAGLLRPVDEAPPIREQPLVVSLMATLASGLLVGPAGSTIVSNGDLLSFFDHVRSWYGNDPGLIGSANPPTRSEFDLGLSHPTRFESFWVYVPFADVRPDIPASAPVLPPQLEQLLEGIAADTGVRATMQGPFGYGDEQWLPAAERLPYTIQFENPASSRDHVSELRIVTQLDGDVDPRTFQLGDMRLGGLTIHLPAGRSTLQADFDFTQQLGFVSESQRRA